jgi:hypothetical protein
VTVQRSGVVRWEDARLERPDQPALRVTQIGFQWKVEKGEPIVTVIRSEPFAIVRDAVAGTLNFYDDAVGSFGATCNDLTYPPSAGPLSRVGAIASSEDLGVILFAEDSRYSSAMRVGGASLPTPSSMAPEAGGVGTCDPTTKICVAGSLCL